MFHVKRRPSKRKLCEIIEQRTEQRDAAVEYLTRAEDALEELHRMLPLLCVTIEDRADIARVIKQGLGRR